MNNDIERLILGQKLKDLVQLPKAKQITRDLADSLISTYPLRDLGWNITDGAITISEEARANHIHILGTTRSGKSKLLEQFIQQDIDGGHGCLFLDPSDNGQTAYNILRYCIDRGHHKVCLIDPHDREVVPTINPLAWRGADAADSVVANLMDSIRVLWGQTSYEATPRIQSYLKAVFTALYATGKPKRKEEDQKPLNCTITDALNFTAQSNPRLALNRAKILSYLHPMAEARIKLEEVFAFPKGLFLTEFGSSIRRLDPFFSRLPQLIFGSSDTPLDFRKMISENWVVLVNLDKARVWGAEQQRLLGTLVINDVVNSMMDLINSGYEGRYYIYIDEAGQFATRVLSDIMAYKGKSGLWATVSHQYYGQFEDKTVLEAVENLCKIKVLFQTPNATDRLRMIRDMYGGELSDREVSYNLSHLRRQEAVFKITTTPPVLTRIADVRTPEIDPSELERFKTEIIYQQPWYRTPKAVLEEINGRFKVQSPTGQPAQLNTERRFVRKTGRDNKVSRSRAGNDRSTDHSDTPGDQSKSSIEAILAEKEKRWDKL